MPQLDKLLFKIHFNLLTKFFLFIYCLGGLWILSLELEMRKIQQQILAERVHLDAWLLIIKS